MRPIVSLLSDFGLKDSYVAEMKAVILSICGNAQIVDISHLVTKFDVRMGAFVLASAASRFPKGAVHVAVVDPSVGTWLGTIVSYAVAAPFAVLSYVMMSSSSNKSNR